MAAINTLDVHVNRDVVGKLTLTVRVIGMRRAKARLWLATRLCAIAAMIAGTGFKVEVE